MCVDTLHKEENDDDDDDDDNNNNNNNNNNGLLCLEYSLCLLQCFCDITTGTTTSSTDAL
jgi:hypothetical protein